MYSCGTGIFFINSNNELLLFLRDDISTIPYRNCWDIIGGHCEKDESPIDCIKREVLEELEIEIKTPKFFGKYFTHNTNQYIYYIYADLIVEETVLNEGQKIEWFNKEKFVMLPENKIGFDFKPIILEMFSYLENNSKGK